ncbi:hypothetical protein VTO73DRAFT_13648 [Trametes versicolor]
MASAPASLQRGARTAHPSKLAVGAVAVAAPPPEGPYAAYGPHNRSSVHPALPERSPHHTRDGASSQKLRRDVALLHGTRSVF